MVIWILNTNLNRLWNRLWSEARLKIIFKESSTVLNRVLPSSDAENFHLPYNWWGIYMDHVTWFNRQHCDLGKICNTATPKAIFIAVQNVKFWWIQYKDKVTRRCVPTNLFYIRSMQNSHFYLHLYKMQ